MPRGEKTSLLWTNPEYRRKMSLSHLGKVSGNKGKRGHIPWNTGLTKETDCRVLKLSNSLRRSYKNGRIGWNKGRAWSEEHKRKVSESEKGKFVSEETRRKISEHQKGRSWEERMGKELADKNREKFRNMIIQMHKDGVYKKNSYKRIEGYKKYRARPEIKERFSMLAKKRFNDRVFLTKWCNSTRRKPSKMESKLIDFFKSEGLPYKFVGDYSFWLGGKNPDFLNVNGQKKLIELYGDYWHNIKGRMSEKERKKHFKKYGFDCLIIWENELKDMEQVKNKIRGFDENGRYLEV